MVYITSNLAEFVEEKMKINEMMRKIKEIENAYPLLRDIDKRLKN